MASARVHSATSNRLRKASPKRKIQFPVIPSQPNLVPIETNQDRPTFKSKTTSASLYRLAKKNLKQMYEGSNAMSNSSLQIQPEKTDEDNEGSLNIIQESMSLKSKIVKVKSQRHARNQSSGETRTRPTDPFDLEHELLDQDGNIMSVKDFIQDAILL